MKSECPSPVPSSADEPPPAAEEQSSRTDPVAAGDITDLSSFLISRACQNAVVANYLYWWVAERSHRRAEGRAVVCGELWAEDGGWAVPEVSAADS